MYEEARHPRPRWYLPMTLAVVFAVDAWMLLSVTLRQYAVVTSTAALVVAMYAVWLSRKAARTVYHEVLPQLRTIVGDDDVEGT